MKESERAFVQTVRGYYRKHGRHDLPWRSPSLKLWRTKEILDPYKIAVSEIMLQQTQVPRVIEKYREFLKSFPNVRVLAQAPLGEVLRMWSGLGYNRRAKFLHQMAQSVVKDHKGKFPETIEGLQSLPGIGPYTAGAIYAFAYDKPHPVIETNIRTVYIHHFFPRREKVTDAELMKVIEKTLDTKKPREWYWALMDYGSYLKASGIKNNAKSKHYTKQSIFNGSRRQVRGGIMKVLLTDSATATTIAKKVAKEKALVQSVLDDLAREGFVVSKKGTYSIV